MASFLVKFRAKCQVEVSAQNGEEAEKMVLDSGFDPDEVEFTQIDTDSVEES